MIIRLGNHCFRRKSRCSLDTQDSQNHQLAPSCTNCKKKYVEPQIIRRNYRSHPNSPWPWGMLFVVLGKVFFFTCKVGVLKYLPQEVAKFSFSVN